MSLTETSHLLRAAQLGDGRALDDLYARHAGRLLGFIRVAMTGDVARRVAAEDILQETLLESARKLDAFEPRGPSSFYRWLVEIARYKLAEARRAGRALKRANERPLDDAPLLGVTSTPSRHAVAHEQVEQLAAGLEGLGERRAEAIRLRYLEGLTVAETAERMDCSGSAVKSLVARGLGDLADRLDDPGAASQA